MAQVRVVRRGGGEAQLLEARNGLPLMELLRDSNFAVQGTCGGACACGTCHVYVAPDWNARLPAMLDDEQMMLEAIGELVEVRPNSRLSCQITISEELSGIEIEVGPVA